MTRKCIILKCANRSTDNVSLFHFPYEIDVKKEWARFADIPLESIRRSHVICSKHFSRNSFKFTNEEGYKRILKKNAIPTILEENIQSSSNESKDNQNIGNNSSKKYRKQDENYSLNAKAPVTRICCICGVLVSGVSQFSFPKDPMIRTKWAQFCNMDETNIKNWFRVCRNHFTIRDFVPGNINRPKLQKSAVPSIHYQRKPDVRVIHSPVCSEEPGFSSVIGHNFSSNYQELETYTQELRIDTQSTSETICKVEDLQVPGSSVQNLICSQVCKEEPLSPTMDNDFAIDNQKQEIDTHSTIVTTSPVEDMQVPVFSTEANEPIFTTPTTSRKRSFPRYMGDIKTTHLETPKCHKLCLDIARRTVEKLTKEKKKLQRENRELKKKIEILMKR